MISIKKEVLIIGSLLLIGIPIGIINMLAFRDFYHSLVPGGRYGTLHYPEFSRIPLLEVQSGERIDIRCSSSKSVTVGIVGSLSNPPFSSKDFYDHGNGTNVHISWVANQTQGYDVVILPTEAGDTRFSITAGKEPVSRGFPLTVILTEAIGGVISMTLFYYWYKVLVKGGKGDWKFPWRRTN